MVKLQKYYVIPFGFTKGNTEYLSYQLRVISSFLINLLNTWARKKKHFTFIVDCGWRASRLPSLARVLLCLVRVGVPQVSWSVRYLDKPRWRAVE